MASVPVSFKEFHLQTELCERKLTQWELEKREEIAKAIEREHPDMPMSQKMAIATAAAKKAYDEKIQNESMVDRVDAQGRRRMSAELFVKLAREKAKNMLDDKGKPDHVAAYKQLHKELGLGKIIKEQSMGITTQQQLQFIAYAVDELMDADVEIDTDAISKAFEAILAAHAKMEADSRANDDDDDEDDDDDDKCMESTKIEEISKNAASSYVRRASSDIGQRGIDVGYASARRTDAVWRGDENEAQRHEKEADDAQRKMSKRLMGINRALRRLARDK